MAAVILAAVAVATAEAMVLDTVLSAWSNGRIYVHAVYRVSYYLDSDPNTEHGFTLDVPVMYMRVD